MSRTSFITGAASGIGLEVACALLDRGERVIVGARSEERCAQARSALGDRGETVVMDVSSLASIRAGVHRVRAIAPKLDVLVNNAGVLETKKTRAADGREMTWAVNVVAPFVLAESLAPSLEAAEEPRVINVGSVAHRAGKIAWDDLEFDNRKYSGWSAYAQSKLALVLVTREFARRHPAIAANCVHPGGIATGIYRNVPSLFRTLLARVLPAAGAGAVPIVYLATEPGVRGVTGKYFEKTREATPAAAALDDGAAARLYAILTKNAPVA